jgi:hypothetical protein
MLHGRSSQVENWLLVVVMLIVPNAAMDARQKSVGLIGPAEYVLLVLTCIRDTESSEGYKVQSGYF